MISVEVEDPWEQAWALYYLRGFRVSVEHPSYLLTAQGSSLDASAFRHRPVDLVLRERGGRLVLEPAAIGAPVLRR